MKIRSAILLLTTSIGHTVEGGAGIYSHELAIISGPVSTHEMLYKCVAMYPKDYLKGAAQSGNIAIVQKILRAPHLVVGGLTQKVLRDAFIVAATHEHFPVAHSLLNALSLDTSILPSDAISAMLFDAAAHGQQKVVDALLDPEVNDVSLTQEDVQNAFMAAVQGGHLSVVKSFLSDVLEEEFRPSQLFLDEALELAFDQCTVDCDKILEFLIEADSPITVWPTYDGVRRIFLMAQRDGAEDFQEYLRGDKIRPEIRIICLY